MGEVVLMLGDSCFMCNSRRCFTRIYTKDLEFDEVACDKHIHDLEIYADKTLNRKLRTNETCSNPLSRAKKHSLPPNLKKLGIHKEIL